jgi:hypothetical protein
MGISLSKIEQVAPELLSLAKTADIAVSKNRLRGQKFKVALALDFSGSMGRQYKDGSMQRLAEQVLALATQLDDDGAIDLFLFDTHAEYVGEVTLANFRNIIETITSKRRMGTTNYADLFRKLVAHYKLTPASETVVTGTEVVKGGLFKKDTTREITETRLIPLKSPVNEPVLAIFLTDGAPDSRKDAVTELTNASFAPIFWQFLSIGSENIPFLQKLDDLPNRYIDNADYKPVGNVDSVSDAELYDMILDECPAWVVEERRRGQIR